MTSLDIAAAEQTFNEMRAGTPIIHQGVLRDAESRTYGAPDLLVRSDVLRELVPGSLSPEQAAANAPDLGTDSWHYVVVDVKFTTLHLKASGAVANGSSLPAYKSQVYVYNRALGRLQGIEPPAAFILGRGWRQQVGGATSRCLDAMDRLGHVPKDASLAARADAAAAWLRRVRSEGSGWEPVPFPTAPELWPNMKTTSDFPWHTAKRQIAEALSDLTMLWMVGPDKRAQAHRLGIYGWKDRRLTTAAVGVAGTATEPTLQAILDVNREPGEARVSPDHVRSAETEWRPVPRLEFYVDFETVSSLNDNFSRIPKQNGQPLIFMIGCGHMKSGVWAYRNFCVERLTEVAEARAIEA